MKRICSLLFLCFCTIIYGHSSDLTTAQLAQLAKAKSISEVSSLAISNGYKLAYKKDGANGWEGYDVTDMAWGYNATYIPATNNWSYSGNFSAIKILYDNAKGVIANIAYVLSDSKYFLQIKTQITSFGYKLYREDTNTFPNSIAYCFYNENLGLYAIFQELYGNGGFQIHFYHE